jgi:hypothetical protein
VEGGWRTVLKRRGPGLTLLVVDVGPSPLRSIVVLRDLGVQRLR